MSLPQSRLYTTDDIYALPEGKRTELIDGLIYDMAPPNRIHQKLISQLTKISLNCWMNLSDRTTDSAYFMPAKNRYGTVSKWIRVVPVLLWFIPPCSLPFQNLSGR